MLAELHDLMIMQKVSKELMEFVPVGWAHISKTSRLSVELRLQSVMMADVSWCRSRIGIRYLKEFCFQSCTSGK